MSALRAALLWAVVTLAAAAAQAGVLVPDADGRVSLLSVAPSAPESPEMSTPEAALAAYRSGAMRAPAPLEGYFTAHWFVAETRAGAVPHVVAIWQALIAEADLWLFDGDRLVAHHRAGVTLDAPGAAPAFAAGYALPVANTAPDTLTLVLRVEPLMFLGTDVELATEARVRHVAALRGMLFPGMLGLILGVALLHVVLWLRFGEWRNGVFAGVLALVFFDWFLWLGGLHALGAVTSRELGFALVAGSEYAMTFGTCLLVACIFAAPLRRRLAALAVLSAVFAVYVLYPLLPVANPERFLAASLLLSAAQIAVIAALAIPALARGEAGTRCALAGATVQVLQSVVTFAPMALPGMEAINTALAAWLGHFDLGALWLEFAAVAMISLSLWDRHRAAIRAREIAEQEARLEAVRVAQICHDIRSPLHAVQSLLTALDLDDGHGGDRNGLSEARGVLASVRHLVEDIVAAARTGGAPERRDRPVDLETVARRAAAAARADSEERGIPIRVTRAPGAPRRVASDAVALERILCNLAVNAVRASRSGPVEIAIGAAPQGGARLAVVDDGPGLPEAARARLLGGRCGREAQGRGGRMGLSVVGTLADGLGARLSVASGARGGTRISVDLPAAGPVERSQPVAAGLRLLVIEDDPVSAAALAVMLRADGHHVATAEGARRGVALAAEGGFDAALVDLDLGAEGGADAVRDIRRLRDPVCAGLPVIIVSGRADIAGAGSRLGAQGVLHKPFDAATLRAALAPLTGEVPASAPAGPDSVQLHDLADALSHQGFRDLIESAEAQLRACGAIILDPASDPERARKAAHRLGGTAAIAGLQPLLTAARAFEATSESDDPAFVDARRRGVGAEISRALVQLAEARPEPHVALHFGTVDIPVSTASAGLDLRHRA